MVGKGWVPGAFGPMRGDELTTTGFRGRTGRPMEAEFTTAEPRRFSKRVSSIVLKDFMCSWKILRRICSHKGMHDDDAESVKERKTHF